MMTVRQDTRFSVRCPVTYLLQDKTWQGRTFNLSRRGGAVESDEMLSVGESVSLQIVASGQPTAIRVELGRVCQATRREFGVEFMVILQDSKVRLNNFLIEVAKQRAV